jgi:broad specificity phosphatase PhoE
MKIKQATSLFVLLLSLVYIGCDSSNNTTPIEESPLEVISTVDNLPKCDNKNQGETHIVGHEETLYFCFNETWQTLEDTTHFSVTCKDGYIEVISKATDSNNNSNPDFNFIGPTFTLDFYGYAQKGPFMIGSSIQVTELDSSQFYRPSQRSFDGCLFSKNGRFEFTNVQVLSRYLQVSASGFYRNEITGERSQKTLTLKSIVDMNNRDSVNINVLTHLESGRLEQLIATSGGYLPINQAKEQAAKEVLKAFEIDIQNWNNQSISQNTMHVEDFNLFGNSDSSAALLAISIMLQGNRSEDEVANVINQISDDLKGDGYWNDMNLKTKIADWLMVQDTSWQYNSIRNNISQWNFGPIPNFEKHLRNFWSKTYGFEACNESTAGQVKYVNNNSSAFYASYYSHIDNTKLRFICDASSKMWRAARDIEKDTIGFGPGKYDKEIREGLVNTGNFYLYEQSNLAWRLATPQEADGFTDILEVYSQLAADEKVFFVIRHAERTNDTGKDGKLTDNGVNQAKKLGASLVGEDFFYASSDFFRASETCRNIAVGKGQSNYKIETWEALSGEWYILNSSKLESYKNSNGGGWQVFSKWAFLNEYSDAFYDLEKRSEELLEDYVFANLSKVSRAGVLCSHDQLVVPLLAYTTNKHANVRYYENKRWLNYLSGVAIIINSKGEARYIPIKSLETGTM